MFWEFGEKLAEGHAASALEKKNFRRACLPARTAVRIFFSNRPVSDLAKKKKN
jgi:hypothetical protein